MEQPKENNSTEGIPIRERVRVAKKIFSVKVRSNKNSKYITLPTSIVKLYTIEPGDQIELAFIGIESSASETKEDAKKRKQKMVISE